MVILMNIVAFFLILALLGLISVIVLLYLTTRDYIRTGKKASSLVEPPVNAGLEVYNRLQGIVLVAIERVTHVGTVVTSAASVVGECVSVVSTVATDTAEQVNKLKVEAEKLETTVGNANDSMRLARQFVEILKQVKR